MLTLPACLDNGVATTLTANRERAYPVRNKPLDEVKNQKNKEYIASKGEMDLKVPNHEQANRNGAVLNGEVRELKAREEYEPKKAEGGDRGLL